MIFGRVNKHAVPNEMNFYLGFKIPTFRTNAVTFLGAAILRYFLASSGDGHNTTTADSFPHIALLS